MKTIRKTISIQSSIVAVWKCLTSEHEMEKWGASPAKFEPKLNGEFYMWGDYLKGKVVEINEPKLLVQQWQVDGMDEPSIVTFNLSEEEGLVRLDLEHTKIPDELKEELDDGWDEYYLGAIKSYLNKI